jgi:hypothetical protein
MRCIPLFLTQLHVQASNSSFLDIRTLGLQALNLSFAMCSDGTLFASQQLLFVARGLHP